jgi:hypothetical protein
MNIQEDLWNYDIKEYLLPRHLWRRYSKKRSVILELKNRFVKKPNSSLMVVGEKGYDKFIKIYEEDLSVCYIYIPANLDKSSVDDFIYSIWYSLNMNF